MTVRDRIVDYALWGVANEPQIHYSQRADLRFAALRWPMTLPLYTDCSAFYTLLCAWAGAPDPNGLGYNGSGYTGTLLGHLPEIALSDLQPGDPIVYGPGGGDHVVVVIPGGSRADPLTVSHGQEAGPIKVRHSSVARAHRAPVRFLRLTGTDAAPPPAPPPRRYKVNAIFTDPTHPKETQIAELRDGARGVFLRNVRKGSPWYGTGDLPEQAGKPLSLDAGYRPDGTLDVSVRTDQNVTWVNGFPPDVGPHGEFGFRGWYVPA